MTQQIRPSSPLARAMRPLRRMDTTSRWFVTHERRLRLGWLLLLVILAACNNSDGGGNGY